jgi:nucleoside-diphosphate-sugar epimerase
MRCLVTGASGHIGSYLVKRLLSAGAEVLAMVRPESDLWRLTEVLDQLQILQVDLQDITQVETDILQFQPATVFHLAWQGASANKARNKTEQITTNIIHSLELFQIAQKAGCQCWIGTGSLTEYGPYSEILHERLMAQPVSAYAVAKFSLGLLLQKLCELNNIQYVWLRLTGVYGPKDNINYLIPSIILSLLEGKRPSLTPGEQQWDYLYVEDAAEGIFAAAQNEVSGIYNLSTGQTYSIKHIAETIRDMIDPSLPLGIGDIPYNRDQIMLLQGSPRRFQTKTGWKPKFSLEGGLERTVMWYKSYGAAP